MAIAFCSDGAEIQLPLTTTTCQLPSKLGWTLVMVRLFSKVENEVDR